MTYLQNFGLIGKRNVQNLMRMKVLVIYYSQTGQLKEIIDNLTEPFQSENISVEKVAIEPEIDYPFPWTSQSFYDVMPDCVLEIPVNLKPLVFKEEKYDLIILGWQPWFLSPSIPVNSLLQHSSFRSLLKNTPVVTIAGARNMWMNAFVRIKKKLLECEASIVGNIALIDKNINPLSYITIFHWLLGGKKTRLMGIFPLPGISESDIINTRVFGETIYLIY